MKGALSVVLHHCSMSCTNQTPLTTKEKARFEGMSAEMGHQGLRGTLYMCIYMYFFVY